MKSFRDFVKYFPKYIYMDIWKQTANKIVNISDEIIVWDKKEITPHEAALEINDLIRNYFDIVLVTCWDCWHILSHKVMHEWDITCTKCWYQDEECYFPDLFY